MSPFQQFENQLNENVYNMIEIESNLYSHDVKNKFNNNATKGEIKGFIRFLIFSGYYTLYCTWHNYAEIDDLGVTTRNNYMSRDNYICKIINHISITNTINHLKYTLF